MGGIICKHGERSNVYSRCVREKKAREFVIFVKITKKRDVDKAKGEERKGGLRYLLLVRDLTLRGSIYIE